MKSTFGGVSRIILSTPSFELGEGVVISKTFAHLFSQWMMAFNPPGPGGYHPAPWKAAQGGRGIDVTVEIKVPESTSLGPTFTPQETIWWIAALLRLSYYPYLSVPVISDQAFSTITEGTIEPTLTPFETEPRFFRPPGQEPTVLDEKSLEWLKDSWISAGRLLNAHPRFYSALKAFDSAGIRGKASSSMFALWGGLEKLFSPSKVKLRFRIAAFLAAYHEPPGQSRLEFYKRTLKLYDKRCVAAHTAEEVETGPLMNSYVLMRNTLIKIIAEDHLPTQNQLERLLLAWDEDKEVETNDG